MSWLSDISLLRSGWLLAVPLVIVLALVARRRVRALGSWEDAVDPHLMAAMQSMGRVVKGGRGASTLWPVLAAIVTACALTGPAMESRDTRGYRNLDAIVLVVDLSRSMTESPNFAEAVVASRVVAQVAGSRQTGLVVFANDAYLASAMTSDSRALGSTLALLTAETVPDNGSHPARGLALARQVLSDAQIVFADIVLVTDGGGLDAQASAEAVRIAGAGMHLSTLFVPTGQEASSQNADRLAVLGNGIAAGILDPFPVAEALRDRVTTRLAQTDYALILWRDYGRYLLLLALIPLATMFGGRRR